MNALTINKNNLIEVNNTLIKEYINFLDVAPRTVEAYTRNLKRFMNWLNSKGIRKPLRPDIIAYRDYLLTDKAPATVQAYMTAVKLFFKWTASNGLYPNVAENIKGAKVSKTNKKDHLTKEQVEKILKAIDQSTETGKRDYSMILLMATNALRTIEVTRAKVGDLHTLGNQKVLYIQGKGRDEKDEFTNIPELTEKAIREYLAFKGETDSEAYIFTSTSNNNKGQGITTRAIRGAVKKRFKAVGLDSDRLTAHSLRHTGVTLTLENGATEQEAQQYARHSDISTTMIYAHNLKKIDNPCSNIVAEQLNL